jgi:hypothetical protein
VYVLTLGFSNSLICYLSDLHVQNSWVGAAVLRACR